MFLCDNDVHDFLAIDCALLLLVGISSASNTRSCVIFFDQNPLISHDSDASDLVFRVQLCI